VQILAVYNYENITYHVTGMSVINDLKGTKQEGILIYMRPVNPILAGITPVFSYINPDPERPIRIFLDKHDCAHIAKTTKEGRKFWKPFKLPKMKPQ